jgi:superfamily II DNA or RNA helicase
MTVTLRDYQQRAVDEVRTAFLSGHDAVLFQLPTGGGKTLTAGHILGSAAAKGNGAWFICNRIELVTQTCAAFEKLGIEHGIIAAGFTPYPAALVQVCSIDTLKRRIIKGNVRLPKLVTWDECRSLGAAGWTSVYKACKGAKHLGLDATPVRLDGRGLDDYFSHMVTGPTYSELMARGSLVPFECYAPGGMPDVSGVSVSKGEFDQAEIEALMDKPTLTGEVASHYLKYARGKQGITFAVSRKHSEHLAEQYRAAGVIAVHLDGDTDKAVRARTVEAFRRREIQVLTNVNLFSAGFDVPGVEVITDCNPTKSLAMALQRWGRGSRPDEANPNKKSCLLLDHAGNLFRFGLPDMDREWSLEGRKRGEKKKKDEDQVQIKQCAACYGMFWPPPVCPMCGHVHAVEAREPEQVDGELRKISRADMAALARATREEERAAKLAAKEAEKTQKAADREAAKAAREAAKAVAAVVSRQKRREVGMARTLDELKRIQVERGYSDTWAESVWERKGNRAQEVAEAQAEAYLGRYR